MIGDGVPNIVYSCAEHDQGRCVSLWQTVRMFEAGWERDACTFWNEADITNVQERLRNADVSTTRVYDSEQDTHEMRARRYE